MARKRKPKLRPGKPKGFWELGYVCSRVWKTSRILAGDVADQGDEYDFRAYDLEATVAALDAVVEVLGIYHRREIQLDYSVELPPAAIRDLKIQQAIAHLDESVKSLPEGFTTKQKIGFEFADWIESVKRELLEPYPDGLTTYLFPDNLPPKFDNQKSPRRRSKRRNTP